MSVNYVPVQWNGFKYLYDVVFLAAAVKIVRPYQRGIVERLGKYKETVDPGLQLIVPFIDSGWIVQ